ncbi:prolyl endopeptidase-like [Brienomyrus brachyistius]|uniref:prolyl endopeptidase-like n=1 Tax=Brienomyrus brachyistius TaxID=42636 RepID=UPI0020B1CA3F|nr:prolyl endopeptidase-like [Brienomyrus brachyistius]
MIIFRCTLQFIAWGIGRSVLSLRGKHWPFCQTRSRRSGSAGVSSYLLETSKQQLQKYRDQERYFKRKVRDAYQRFSEVPDNTVIQGRHHVYFEEGGNIYRMGIGQGNQDVQDILDTSSGGSLQRVRLSPGEHALAATVKDCGSEEAKCLVLRLGDPPDPPRLLLQLDGVFSFEWASDDVLFFTSMENLRSCRVFRLDFGKPEPQAVLVYEERDPEFFVEVSCTRDRNLVTLNCNNKSTSEVWLVEADAPLACPRLSQPRVSGLIYHVEHSGKQLYILANTAPGQEYQVLSAPLASPGMENWVPVFTPDVGTGLKDMEVVQDHCVLAVRTPAGPLGLQVVPLADPSQVYTVQLPLWACEFESRPCLGLDSPAFQFSLSSPVQPPLQFSYCLRERQLFVEETAAGPPLLEHHTARLEARSQDGTLVPMTVFHRAPWGNLKGAPLLLHVYGAYGLHLNMAFSPEKQLLLEDGWVLAYCHVRGGGERGLGWHQAGSFLQKYKGLEDLASCIHHLYQLGVSQPALANLSTRSAGAVLAGALCNQYPELLRTISLQAPFLDVLGTMQDPSLPLTIEDRGEWGDPLADTHQRDTVASYCPCHNIKPQRYPSMLITAYEGDRRVPLAGVLRYAERLVAAAHADVGGAITAGSKTPPSVILDLQPGGDHFGPDNLEASLNETARQLAFLYGELGLGHGRYKD